MIDIIIATQNPMTMFTIASLMNKKDKFRLHIFTTPVQWEWAEPLHAWALKNIPRCYIYQTPWNLIHGARRDAESRLLLQFRQHWKDKNLDIERVLLCTGNPVFIQEKTHEGQLPTFEWMQENNKVAMFSRKFQYDTHPFFKNYYKTLNISTTDNIDYQAILINWKKFMTIPTAELFFPMGKWRRHTISSTQQTYHHNRDSFVLSAHNSQLFNRLSKNKEEWGWAPTYFNGRMETLIEKEAFGPKDCINHNIMLRKSYMLNMPRGYIIAPYSYIPSLIFLSIPFDVIADLIPLIPANVRLAGLNECIMEKSRKQKKTFKSVIDAGYLYGKI